MRRNKYIYIATRLIVVAAAVYTYFEFKDMARQQERRQPDGSIPTIIVRDPSPGESAVWMTLYQHKSAGKLHLDVTGDGRLLVVAETTFGKTARRTEIDRATVDVLLKTLSAESLLPASDADPGERLFSEAEWVQGGVRQQRSIRNFGPAPLQSYPEELRTQVQNLRTIGQGGEQMHIERFVVAEPVDPRRRESIENDPRKFYSFVKKERSSLPVSVRAAITSPGRHIPIFEPQAVQQIEKLRTESNPKTIGHDFFLTTSGGSFQLQLVPGTAETKKSPS